MKTNIVKEYDITDVVEKDKIAVLFFKELREKADGGMKSIVNLLDKYKLQAADDGDYYWRISDKVKQEVDAKPYNPKVYTQHNYSQFQACIDFLTRTFEQKGIPMGDLLAKKTDSSALVFTDNVMVSRANTERSR